MIEKALRLGASEVEIFEINARMHNVYIDNGDPKIATSNSWKGTGIKCIRNGHIGFSGGSSPEETLKRSIHLMKIAPKDENFHSLPSPKSASGEVDGTYNPDLLNEDLVKIGAKVARAAQPVSIMYGLIRAIEYHTHIMNSLGVDGEHRGTILFIHLNAKRGSGEGIVKWCSAGSYSPDALESLGTNLRERTNRTVLARPFSGKKASQP
jgi:Predicted Zn-dependent proteases and their inactivated homologs